MLDCILTSSFRTRVGFTIFVLIIYLCIYSVILCNPRNSTTPTGCNVVFLYQIIIKIITILTEQIEQVLPQKGCHYILFRPSGIIRWLLAETGCGGNLLR